MDLWWYENTGGMKTNSYQILGAWKHVRHKTPETLPGSFTMNFRFKINLYIELYYTLTNWKPNFMREIFEIREIKRTVRKTYKINL